MNNSDHFVFVTQNRLADFARYDAGFTDLIGGEPMDTLDYKPGDVECESSYPMMLQDLRDALETFNDQGTDVYNFLLDWWLPMLTYFYTDLCLDEIMGPDASIIGTMEVPDLPDSEEDVLVTIFNVIGRTIDIREFSQHMPPPLRDVLDLDSMIEMIDNFMEDKELPIDQRRYTRPQKLAVINHWNNNMLLEDATDEIKSLFRKFTDELCEEGAVEAIKAKAYALYGGSPVYECDYKESARLLEILWQDYSFGYAANTLGYIYYYGRLDGGVPNYERAFYYYSVAASFNITEAKYKLADMFMNGYYVAKNPPMAFQTYLKLYNETKYQFEAGDPSCDFADCALRLADSLKMIPGQEIQRYKILLEAKYAIDKRLLEAPDFGDRRVKDKITTALEDSNKALLLKPGFAKGKTVPLGNNDYTQPIEEFVNIFPGLSYELTVKKLRSDKYKLTIARLPEREGQRPRLSLSSQPWSDFCGLVSKITFTVDKGPGTGYLDFIVNKCEGIVFFDSLEISDPLAFTTTSTFDFYDRGHKVCLFTADKVFYNKAKDEA
ncbi:MAG: hypothetical protein K5745_07730 [Saccharofermentans sp.]|nr:hypothetical protein [Saccharofermentans sp.]